MMKPLVLAYVHQRAAVIVMLLAACLLTAFGADSPVALFAIALGTALLSWMVVPSGINAFTCALPIRGGDLVLSRVLGVVAVTVIPVVGWVVVEYGSEQTPATILMPSVQLGALAIALGVAAAGAWIRHVVPDALPLPINERGGRKRGPDRGVWTGTGPTWWSAMRAALPPIFVLYCAVLIGAAAVGTATLVYGIVLVSLPGIISHRVHWLAVLPLSDRQRAQMIVVPAVAASVACIMIGRALQLSVLTQPQPPSADYGLWMIDAAVLLALGVTVLLLAEVGGVLSRRRRGVVGLLLGELATLAVAAVAIADIVPRMQGREGIVAHTARMLHDTAASSAVHAWGVVVIAVVVLVTAYALLERVFRRSGTLTGADVQAA